MKGATAQSSINGRIAIVSIHAPVKGATSGSIPFFLKKVVSIHAPVKGATVLIKDTVTAD